MIILLFGNVFAQQFKLTGKIIDTTNGKGIGYAVIQPANTYKSTCTNSDGDFEITLPDTKCTLITESIGYEPDTLCIEPKETKQDLNIYLKPWIPSKKIYSGNVFSASGLIAQVISEKDKMFKDLSNYNFDAYTRCVTRENNDVGLGSGSIRIDPGIVTGTFDLISNIWKTRPMKIDGIDEFTSKGYYKIPDSYSEIVVRGNSRGGLPRSLEALLGSRRIQNLCGNELLFFDRPLPGPVSSGALSYYKYSFEDTMWCNNENLFKIHFEPFDKDDPGLIGDLYIAGSTVSVVKIEAKLNEAANNGNTFDSVFVMQQFFKYNDHFYLPVNYMLTANSDYMGIVMIRYDYNALMENYEINTNETENKYSEEMLAILPETGRTDSVSWSDQRAVPFTREETEAYENSEGFRYASKGFFYSVARIFSPQYRLNNRFSTSGPLGIYQFNHVEGHSR